MKLNRIKALLPSLPEDAPYLSGGCTRILNMEHGGTSRLGEVEKFAKCIDDPRFGWHFIRSFVTLGRPLPDDVTEDYLRRAYNWECMKEEDPMMAETVSLLMPDRTHKRNMLEALLLCRDKSMKQIAAIFGIAIEVVWLYDQLFFNVRDRLDEKPYIAGIVMQESRITELLSDYATREDPGMLMKRVALDSGSEWVLDMSACQNNVKGFDRAKSTEQLAALHVSMGVRAGYYGLAGQSDLGANQHGVRIIQAGMMGGAEGGGMDKMGLMEMSAGRGIFDTVMQLQKPDLERRRLLQNAAAQVREEQKAQAV